MNIYLAKRTDPHCDIAWGHNIRMIYTASDMKEALAIADKYILCNGGRSPVTKPDGKGVDSVNATLPFLKVHDIFIVQIGVSIHDTISGDAVKDDPRILCIDNVGA